ncbi:MAG: alpha/beta fold hydrolase [Bacilli bacterium]|nr:alpha/beta fold hydrolase [Bacilli bacterium]
MEIWQIVLIILGIMIIIRIIGFLICGSICYHFVFDRRKGDKDFAKNENIEAKNSPDRLWYFAQNIEELTICSFDKLTLKGYLLRNNSNKLAIILHGYRGRYYSSVSQARIFYESGFDVFMPNNRAHDTSEGKQFSMGPKEVKDLLNWINYLLKINPNYQIALMGISMGAHIVMLSVGQSMPNNVKCFIEDCGYTNLMDELKFQLKKSMKVAHPKFLMWLNNLYIQFFHHFSMNSSTENSLPKTKIPGLFIHGDKDNFVPFDNLEKNYSLMSNNVDKKKVVFENKEHNRAITDKDKYKMEVINFVNKYIE